MIQSYIRRCDICQRVNLGKRGEDVHIIVGPLEMWEMDFVGPFPNGQHVFTMIDVGSGLAYTHKRILEFPWTSSN